MLLRLDEINPWPDAAEWSLMYLGAIEAYLGERTSYDSHRRRILTRYAQTTQPWIAERMAKTSLLLPLEGEGLNTALELAERALTTGPTNNLAKYLFFAGALAKYRAGQWAVAAERAERSMALVCNGPISLAAMDHLVLAMARFKMSQPDEARAALAKANEIIQREFPSIPSPGFANWHDILTVHVLFREAKKLIEPNNAPTSQ